MSFTEAVRTCFKKYATISGRAQRAEFWWFILFQALIPLIIILITLAFVAYAYCQQSRGINASEGASIAFLGIFISLYFIMQIVSLALLVPNICVIVRRFHDVGHSGFEIFFGLIPYVGAIYCLVLCLLPSEEGDNQYGPNPNAPELSADVQKEEE